MLSPAGSDVDSVCRQYPGVWPNFGEDVETVQGVHTASARQKSGRPALLDSCCLFALQALMVVEHVCAVQ